MMQDYEEGQRFIGDCMKMATATMRASAKSREQAELCKVKELHRKKTQTIRARAVRCCLRLLEARCARALNREELLFLCILSNLRLQ